MLRHGRYKVLKIDFFRLLTCLVFLFALEMKFIYIWSRRRIYLVFGLDNLLLLLSPHPPTSVRLRRNQEVAHAKPICISDLLSVYLSGVCKPSWMMFHVGDGCGGMLHMISSLCLATWWHLQERERERCTASSCEDKVTPNKFMNSICTTRWIWDKAEGRGGRAGRGDRGGKMELRWGWGWGRGCGCWGVLFCAPVAVSEIN